MLLMHLLLVKHSVVRCCSGEWAHGWREVFPSCCSPHWSIYRLSLTPRSAIDLMLDDFILLDLLTKTLHPWAQTDEESAMMTFTLALYFYKHISECDLINVSRESVSESVFHHHAHFHEPRWFSLITGALSDQPQDLDLWESCTVYHWTSKRDIYR